MDAPRRGLRWLRSIPGRFWAVELRLRRIEEAVFVASTSDVAAVADLLRPRPSSHRFERIGVARDGGYVVAEDLGVPTIAISIGVGNECSVDEELAKRGVRVFQFDHTVERSPSAHPNISFHRRGLGTGSEGETVSLATLVDLTGAPDGAPAWLLLDAEGVEWDLLTSEAALLRRFDQLLIEFHLLSLLGDPGCARTMLAALESLENDFVSVSWHPNNFSPLHVIGGFTVPDVIELGFVRKDLFRPGPDLPEPGLLLPNDSLRPEHPEPFIRHSPSALGPVPASLASALSRH